MNDHNKINLLKKGLLSLLNLLNDGDRMCLIAFSTESERLSRLINIGKDENR
jgi:hypothetical protein